MAADKIGSSELTPGKATAHPGDVRCAVTMGIVGVLKNATDRASQSGRNSSVEVGRVSGSRSD